MPYCKLSSTDALFTIQMLKAVLQLAHTPLLVVFLQHDNIVEVVVVNVAMAI
jgi:hypothetical protein